MKDLISKLAVVPESPGVYMVLDRDQTVIFVSRTDNLKEQMHAHLGKPKSKRDVMIKKKMRDIKFEVIEDELEATERELELIQEYYPPLNGRKKGMKQYRFIKVTTDETFPRVRKRKMMGEEGTYLGPFPKNRHIQVALSVAANYFEIADCGKEIVLGDDHKIVKTCIRRRTKQCMRPCEVEVDQDKYNKAIEGFMAFFRGENTLVIDHLKEEMKEAAKDQNFEKAAKLRDDLQSIKKVL